MNQATDNPHPTGTVDVMSPAVETAVRYSVIDPASPNPVDFTRQPPGALDV
jgi:hypothetical protein